MRKNLVCFCLLSLLFFLFTSCTKLLGYGVLLWTLDEPYVESGSVLPVYLKSNIEKKWVVGFPEIENYDKKIKFEIPFNQLQFEGSKKKATLFAEIFAPHAKSYAESMIDGLPIRDAADNNAKRVYKLRVGEVIKILGRTDGILPIGTSGDPLPGNWYKVMTNDGVIGFCFSNRLSIFDQDISDFKIVPHKGIDTQMSYEE